MELENGYVWYACYGSNINRERFMLYIDACADTTPPAEDRPFRFEHSIYFAKATARWDNGGKAFLDDTCPGSAYGRIYKITARQFEEVKSREGVDYTKGLYLGQVDGLPVYSFTDTQKNTPHTAPSVRYFTTILKGLQDCYGQTHTHEELEEYLIGAVFPAHVFAVARALWAHPEGMKAEDIENQTGLAQSLVADGLQWLQARAVICQESDVFALADGPCAGDLITAMTESLPANF